MDSTQAPGVSPTGGMEERDVPSKSKKRKATFSDKKTDAVFEKVKKSDVRMKEISNVLRSTKMPSGIQEGNNITKYASIAEVKHPSEKEQGKIKSTDIVDVSEKEEEQWSGWSEEEEDLIQRREEKIKKQKVRQPVFETAEQILPEYVTAILNEIKSKNPHDEKYSKIVFFIQNGQAQRVDMKKCILEVEKELQKDPITASDQEVKQTLDLLKTMIIGQKMRRGTGKTRAQDIFPQT